MKNSAKDYADVFLKHLTRLFTGKTDKNLFLVLWSVEKRDEILKFIEEMPEGTKVIIMNALNQTCFIRMAIADNKRPELLAGYLSSKPMIIILDQHEKASPEILEVIGATLSNHEESKLYGN